MPFYVVHAHQRFLSAKAMALPQPRQPKRRPQGLGHRSHQWHPSARVTLRLQAPDTTWLIFSIAFWKHLRTTRQLGMQGNLG